MVHYNQRYAFVSSARLDFGSVHGASPFVLGLMSALDAKGKKVALISPPPLRLPPPLLGLWFNLWVTGTLQALDMDVAVGCAGDGHRFARKSRKSKFVTLLPELTAEQIAGTLDTASAAARLRVHRERRACGFSDLVIATSEYARRRVQEAYGLAEEKIAVVPCGVDSEEWKQRDLPEHDRPRVLAVTTGATPGRIEWLLAGFAAARDAGVDAELHLMGDPSRLTTGQRQTLFRGAGAITLSSTRGLRRSEIRAEIGACDAFVQVPLRAGAASNLLWAMATGRAIIAPDTLDFPEVIGSGGRIVPSGDPQALGRALTEVLTSRSRLKELATAARRRALELPWSASAIRFGELLAGL